MEDIIKEQTNAMCAITDTVLCAVLLILVCIFIPFRTSARKTKALWLSTFIALDVSALLGLIVHFFFPEPGTVHLLIWIVLYPLLMEDVILFDLSAISTFTRDARPTRRDTVMLHAVGGVGVLLALLVSRNQSFNAQIVALTAFAAVVACLGFYLFIRAALLPEHKGEKIMLCSFIPLLVGAGIEIKGMLFKIVYYIDQGSVMHFLSTISLVIMFFGVLTCLRQMDASPKDMTKKTEMATAPNA